MTLKFCPCLNQPVLAFRSELCLKPRRNPIYSSPCYKKVMSNNNNSDDYSGEVKKGSSSSSSHVGVQQDLKPHLAAIQQGNVPQGGSAGLATTQFLLFAFCKILFICFEGKSMTTHPWKRLLSLVPPSNSLISVSNSWRAFWGDKMAFKGPQPHLVRCCRNFRDTRTQSGALR